MTTPEQRDNLANGMCVWGHPGGNRWSCQTCADESYRCMDSGCCAHEHYCGAGPEVT